MSAIGLQERERHSRSPGVIVPSNVDWDRDYSDVALSDLADMTNDELATVDPLAMNLIVAKGIPVLGDLRIAKYQRLLNLWTADFAQRCLPYWEQFFHEAPAEWRDDLRYFRLGMICQYLEQEARIEYKRDQRHLTSIRYTNPSDLFLNGVLDTREGTCGTLAALQVAIAWRLRWPVSLACVNSHFIVRYDDGETIYNIEATTTGRGGFATPTDDEIIVAHNLPEMAVACGSDLRALWPRELLGAFVGLRARHLRDVAMSGDYETILQSEPDWLLARQLFPQNRLLYKEQMAVASVRGFSLFDPSEAGHPSTYADCLVEIACQKFDALRRQPNRGFVNIEYVDWAFQPSEDI